MASRWLVVSLAAAASCACGSRSALSVDSVGGATGTSLGGASGGPGGSPNGGTGAVLDAGSGGAAAGGGTGGFGGTAGRVNDCATLTPLDPVLEVDQPPGEDDRLPALTYAAADHERVVIAFAPVPLVSQFRIGVASLFAWQPWPVEPSLSSARYNFGLPIGPPGSLKRVWATESFDGTFAVGEEIQAVGSPTGFSCRKFDPNWIPPTIGACQPITGDFVAKGPSSLHLAGRLQDSWVQVQVVGDSGPSKKGAMGCAPGGILADAVGHNDGWLVAHSNSPGLELTSCTFNVPGPATVIAIARVAADATVSPVLEIKDSAPIIALETVPHALGMYVVWRVASGGIVAPIRFARVNVNDLTVVGPYDLTAPTDVPLDGFSASAAGNRLAVAWGNDPASNPPDIVVSMADENGAVLGRGTLADQFSGRVSAAGSPSGGSVAVGWADATPAGGHQVKLARFDCASGT